MSDLDTRIRAFVGELIEAAPIAPPFPGVDSPTFGDRSPRRRPRLLAVAGAALVVVVIATAIGVLALRDKPKRVNVIQGPTAIAPHVTFSLRLVEETSSPPCSSGLVESSAPARVCYRLAAPFIGQADVESAQAQYNQSTLQWEVDIAVTRAATPRFVATMNHNIGRDVAIVIDDRVVSAPQINSGITGGEVTINGDFDEATAERIAAGLTKSLANPRQHAVTCTTADLNAFASPTAPPPYERLPSAGTYWFGRVHLDPPAGDAHPTVSEAQAWGTAGPGALYTAGIYKVVLAYWTSDANLVTESNGQPAPHDRVLAWVIIGSHVPVEAADADSTTVPGVPCYFGTNITAVDATTGQTIAAALDYGG